MLVHLKNLFKDSATYGISGMLSQIVGFLLLPLYTRYLDPLDYGIVAMMAYIGIFFVPLAALGLGNAVFRRFNLQSAEGHRRLVLGTAAISVFITSVLLFCILMSIDKTLASILVEDADKTDLVLISLVTGIFMSYNHLLTVVLRAKRKVSTIAVVRLVQLLATIFVTIYLVVYLKWGAKGVLLGTMIGTICGFIILAQKSLPTMSFQFSFAEFSNLIAYGLPFLPHRLMGLGTGFVTQFFIKNYIGLAETGLYSIALRFALPVSFVIGAVQSAWVPLKFQIHREDKQPDLAFRRIISFYMLVITVLVVVIVMIGPEMIRWLTPPEYHTAVYFFSFVLLTFFARGLYYMVSTGFEFTNNTKPLPLISGLGFMTLISLGLISVEKMKIYGIILAEVTSWIIRTIAIRIASIKRFFVPLNIRFIASCCITVLIATAASFYLQNFSNFIRILVELAILLAALVTGIYFLTINKDFKELNLTKYLPQNYFLRIVDKLKSKLSARIFL